jgi:RecJ-like exonuclease
MTEEEEQEPYLVDCPQCDGKGRVKICCDMCGGSGKVSSDDV